MDGWMSQKSERERERERIDVYTILGRSPYLENRGLWPVQLPAYSTDAPGIILVLLYYYFFKNTASTTPRLSVLLCSKEWLCRRRWVEGVMYRHCVCTLHQISFLYLSENILFLMFLPIWIGTKEVFFLAEWRLWWQERYLMHYFIISSSSSDGIVKDIWILTFDGAATLEVKLMIVPWFFYNEKMRRM